MVTDGIFISTLNVHIKTPQSPTNSIELVIKFNSIFLFIKIILKWSHLKTNLQYILSNHPLPPLLNFHVPYLASLSMKGPIILLELGYLPCQELHIDRLELVRRAVLQVVSVHTQQICLNLK